MRVGCSAWLVSFFTTSDKIIFFWRLHGHREPSAFLLETHRRRTDVESSALLEALLQPLSEKAENLSCFFTLRGGRGSSVDDYAAISHATGLKADRPRIHKLIDRIPDTARVL